MPGTIPGSAATGNAARENHTHRNGALCALFVAACVWATYPVAEMGFIDDWSYIKTALDFARTGRFIYSGWSAAILGWQIPWGALFIKLFGFSFTVVRLSTLPVAMFTVFLFHAVLRRFGLGERHAVFGCLTLGLSPLFVPMAASYMTDIGGLLSIVLCLYLCKRALDAETGKQAILWLACATVANVIGGTARQIAWLGALVVVPSTGWLLRRRRGVLPATAVLWMIAFLSILACVHWFARQPYSIPEGFSELPSLKKLGHLVAQLIRLLLCLLLVVFPVLVAWTGRRRLRERRGWLRLGGLLLLVLCVALVLIVVLVLLDPTSGRDEFLVPWLINIMVDEGIWSTGKAMLGLRSGEWFTWIRVGLSVLVLATGFVFAEHMLSRPWKDGSRSLEQTADCWLALAYLLGPFSFFYICLTFPIGLQYYIFDRYLLGLSPGVILVLLKLRRGSGSERMPLSSYAALAAFALFAIAGTHNWFALNRARAATGERLRRAGIPDTAIEGGFDYDGWTQIEDGGYINDPRLQVPAGAFHPQQEPSSLPKDCQYFFSNFTPSIKPRYVMTGRPMWCLGPSEFPPQDYTAWMPPFHRKIYVQRFPENTH